jgi:hypothetical protein
MSKAITRLVTRLAPTAVPHDRVHAIAIAVPDLVEQSWCIGSEIPAGLCDQACWPRKAQLVAQRVTCTSYDESGAALADNKRGWVRRGRVCAQPAG